MHGLDWYDFHWRWYNPSIARTTTPDPEQERFPERSGYSWVRNNFPNRIDPDGRICHVSENLRLIRPQRERMGVATHDDRVLQVGAGVLAVGLASPKMLVKGSIGAGVNFGAQLTMSGGDFSAVDITSVGATAIVAGVPGASLGKKIFAGALITADVVLDFSVADGFTNVFDGSKSPMSAVVDGLTSVIPGKISGNITTNVNSPALQQGIGHAVDFGVSVTGTGIDNTIHFRPNPSSIQQNNLFHQSSTTRVQQPFIFPR